MIATARILMPKAQVRLSAGRKSMSREAQVLCFIAGASSFFFGDKLLVTGNPDVEADRRLLREAGMRPSPATHWKRTLRGSFRSPRRAQPGRARLRPRVEKRTLRPRRVSPRSSERAHVLGDVSRHADGETALARHFERGSHGVSPSTPRCRRASPDSGRPLSPWSRARRCRSGTRRHR